MEKDIEKQLHDDFCILIIFLFALALAMIAVCSFRASKGYASMVKQGLNNYSQVVLR